MERKTGGLRNMAQYNLKKDLNYLFAVEDKDGRFIVNAVGNVTASFPFLTETSSKSKLVTPFYGMGRTGARNLDGRYERTLQRVHKEPAFQGSKKSAE